MSHLSVMQRSSRSRRVQSPSRLLAISLGIVTLVIASPLWAQELPEPGTWRTVATLNQARAGHTATLLINGTVLIAGGKDAAGQPLASAELYDPATGHYTQLPASLPAPVWGHTATLLSDGRLLVVGGSNSLGALNSAELYDPVGGTILPGAPLNVPRTLASAALLLDGSVLVAGGQSAQNLDLDTAEVYDPVTNTFRLLPALMSAARSGHLGVQLLHNGRVLISGGTSDGQVVAAAEVYDPVTGTFRPVDSPGTARWLFGANFFEVPYTGILLATGGLDSAQTPLASSEVFFYPTLRTDKPDYSPGETVTLMGEGWRPNEQVAINIHESSGDPDTNLTATADVNGAFTNGQFVVQPSDRGVTFLATATGQTSKWTAQSTFTDALDLTGSWNGTTRQINWTATGLNVNQCYRVRLTRPNTTLFGTSATFTGTTSQSGSFTIPPGEPKGTWRLHLDRDNSCNGSFSNDVKTADVTVTNTAPVAQDKTASTPANTATTITLSATDVDGDSLTVSIVSPPSHGTLNSIGTVTCTSSGGTSSCTAPVTYTPASNYSGPDSFTYKANDGTADSNVATVSITVQASADLSLAKSDGVSSVTAGTSTPYTITLTNNGPSAVPPGGVVEDTIPRNTTGSTSDSRCTLAAGVLTCTTSAALASSAATSFSLTLAVAPDYPGTTLTNTATIDSSPVSDPNTANNSASDTDSVTKSADLSILKTAPATAFAGTDIPYTLTVTNNGPSTSSGGTVTDVLPVQVSFVSASAGCTNTAGTVSCTFGTLAPSATQPFTITVHISPTATGPITNTATVTATNPTEDTNATNNFATAMTTAQRMADLAITKSAPTMATAGTDIIYTLTVT